MKLSDRIFVQQVGSPIAGYSFERRYPDDVEYVQSGIEDHYKIIVATKDAIIVQLQNELVAVRMESEPVLRKAHDCTYSNGFDEGCDRDPGMTKDESFVRFLKELGR